MKRALTLLIVAIITLTIIFIIYRPDLLEKVWLWVIGLIGPVIGFTKKSIQSLLKYIKSLEQNIDKHI